MVTRREWYQRVNAVWPEVIPPLTADEATRAARKLYRYATGRRLTLPIEITTGNRYTWPHNGVLYVNPDSTRHGSAWQSLVHDMSHWLHHRMNSDKPHAKSHAKLELRLSKLVVKRGWLNGTLKTQQKPPAQAVDARVTRQQRILERLKRWQHKQQRAERALAKLQRQARHYERTLTQQ